MVFDELGYPKPTGASDWADSSHLAGMMAVTNHPQQADCTRYIINQKGKYIYVRHPLEKRYDFSRDQAVPLICGLIAQGYEHLVSTDYINGKDILPPSVRGLVRIAKGKKPFFFQRLWFKVEILFHAYFQWLEEPNQIIAMCRAYGPEYLRLWTKHNKLWKWSIRRYWGALDCEWRQEKEFGEHIVKYVEGVINGQKVF